MSRPWAPASRIACHGAFSRSPSAYFWFSPRRVSCSAWSILEPKGYGMGRQIEELAAFVARTGWEDVPEAVQRHAKITLLDTLGVILAGGERPEMRQLRERLSTTAGTGATVYARGWPVQDPRTAAMLNGIAGRSIELCEGLRLVSGQAALQVLPGELALAGFEAQAEAIEEALGQLVGGGFNPDHVAEDLGESWHIMRNYFRLYACCNPIHPALDCLAAVLAELRPRPEEVERIEIATYRFASVMRNPDPPNYFASKYSLPHAAAAMVVRGGAGFAELDDTALADPQIAALRNRVHIAEDPAMSALAPKLRPARVTVTLTDGRQATHARDSHRGDFDEPFTEAELRAKFRELAGTVLTSEGAVQVEAAIDHSEAWPSLAALTDLCRRYGESRPAFF